MRTKQRFFRSDVPTYVTTKGRQQMSRVIWQRVASPPYTNIRNFTHLCTHLELIPCETPVELSLPLADLDPRPPSTTGLTRRVCRQTASRSVQPLWRGSLVCQTRTDHAACDVCKKGPHPPTECVSCGPTVANFMRRDSSLR